MIRPQATAPSLADLEAMAREEFKTLPEELARHVKDVVILVEEFPDEETEKAMELETPFDILGLYQGIALPHQSVGDQRRDVDRILLYRRPILDYWCETGEDLGDIIRNTLIHEIGHHFGFSDADMDRLEGEG